MCYVAHFSTVGVAQFCIVGNTWQQVSFLSLVLLTGLTLISYLLRAYRIYYYFSAPPSSFLTYLRIHLLHNSLNNFLPMRLGEASFPLLMKRYLNVSYIDSSSKLILLRLLDLHWLLLCLLVNTVIISR